MFRQLIFAVVLFLLSSLAIQIDAACTHRSVRLFNGKAAGSAGTVQICYYGTWTDVCDYWWGYITQTKIVCKQLGYTSAKPITTYDAGPAPTGRFGSMSSSSSGYCSYSTIYNCLTRSHYRIHSSSYCNKGRDTVHINCNPQTSCAKQGSARLYNRTTNGASNEGTFQICGTNREWSAVCDYNWGCNHAVTACKQLGNSNPRPTYKYNGGGWTKFGYGPYSYCSSSATNITSCSRYSSSYKNNINYCHPARDSVYLKCNNNLVKNTCSPNYSVRLVGGNSSAEGRLEVCYGGIWHSFCGRYASQGLASTVCNQLGFTSNNYATQILDGRYGCGSVNTFFSYGSCGWWYNHVRYCSFGKYSDDRCRGECLSKCLGIKCHESDNCHEGDIRLVNGTHEREGRLEVCSDGVWGLVCGYFQRSEAYVACKQLGYPNSDNAAIYSGTYVMTRFGSGDRPIVYSMGHCSGGESSLYQCYKSTYTNCQYPNFYALRCLDSCSEGDIRLVGGSSEIEGTVEICYSSRWKLISDHKWDNQDAKAVCRHLRHNGGQAFQGSKFGKPKRGIIYSSVNCLGTEDGLTKCPKIRYPVERNEGDVAGVKCSHGIASKIPDYIVTKISCNNTKYALRGCSQICTERTTNCVGSKLTPHGNNCVCTSCTEPSSGPSIDLTLTLDDAKHYRCSKYCKKMKKCFDGSCDKSLNACVCHYCEPETILQYLKENY